MKKLSLILALMLSVGSLYGCAREGFEESLNRRDDFDPVKVEAQKDMEEEQSEKEDTLSGAGLSIDFEIKEISEGNKYVAYSLPVLDGIHDDAINLITKRIEECILEIENSFDLSKEGSSLEIYDSVGAITEEIISLFYEGEYTASSKTDPVKFAFGLNFNASTGLQYKVSDLMQPHTLASLLLDAQTSRVLGKEEEAKKKMEELSSKGMSSLADRIIASDMQNSRDTLFTFSFYLEKGNLIAIVPMDDDSSDPAYIEIMNDKV